MLLLLLLQNRVQTAFDALPENKRSKKALADYCGVKPPSVNDWFSGKTKSLKGQSLIRAAEYLNVREQWLADGSGPMERPARSKASDPVEYIGAAPAQRLVAVVGQARLGENGWYDVVQAAGTDGFVEAVSSDPEAYALRVVGDSMHPAIKSGWYVLVEPGREPSPSDYVAVALTDGRKMVKEFLYCTGTEVGLQSVNGAKRLTLQLSEIATMHPVGNLLPPGKCRSS